MPVVLGSCVFNSQKLFRNILQSLSHSVTFLGGQTNKNNSKFYSQHEFLMRDEGVLILLPQKVKRGR